MAYDREGKGNVDGINEVVKSLDPLRQKNIMLRESMLTRLKMKAFLDGISESEIIRKALEPLI